MMFLSSREIEKNGNFVSCSLFFKYFAFSLDRCLMRFRAMHASFISISRSSPLFTRRQVSLYTMSVKIIYDFNLIFDTPFYRYTSNIFFVWTLFATEMFSCATHKSKIILLLWLRRCCSHYRRLAHYSSRRSSSHVYYTQCLKLKMRAIFHYKAPYYAIYLM